VFGPQANNFDVVLRWLLHFKLPGKHRIPVLVWETNANLVVNGQETNKKIENA